jgi:hypothetical protein
MEKLHPAGNAQHFILLEKAPAPPGEDAAAG